MKYNWFLMVLYHSNLMFGPGNYIYIPLNAETEQSHRDSSRIPTSIYNNYLIFMILLENIFSQMFCKALHSIIKRTSRLILYTKHHDNFLAICSNIWYYFSTLKNLIRVCAALMLMVVTVLSIQLRRDSVSESKCQILLHRRHQTKN